MKKIIISLGLCLGIYSPISAQIPPTYGGEISGNRTISSGSVPHRILNIVDGSGGRGGPLHYNWQVSVDEFNWETAPGSTNENSYQPPALTFTTYFRREITNNLDYAYSNVITITVSGSIRPGRTSGNQRIVKGTLPSMITNVEVASIEGGSGSISYQWQKSTDNSTWANISGATNRDFYQSGPLTSDTYFRRKAISGTKEAHTFPVKITTIDLWPGVIRGDQTIASGFAPMAITNVNSYSYPDSSEIIYQWQKSIDNSGWVDIIGETNKDFYQSPALTITTYFRRTANLGNQSPASNIVTVTVIPLLPGEISGNQTIVPDSVPSLLTEASPALGMGTITYQWQSSIDKLTWTNIDGATAGDHYQPPGLIATTYYRRQAQQGNDTAVSNIVTVTVRESGGGNNHIITRTFTGENRQGVEYDVTYYDGLGYPSQMVGVGASPSGRSIVTPIFYDELRRESRSYLPYATTNGLENYRPAAKTEQTAFYNSLYGVDSDGYSYRENVYDGSPLSRIIESYNVGSIYREEDKRSEFAYGANTESDEVVKFQVGSSDMLTRPGFYSPNTLYKNSVMDEDGSMTSTFTDFMGRVVLERAFGDNNDPHDTYYVYDDYGNLCYVLPPKLSIIMKTATGSSLADTNGDMKELAYVYKYDGRNRCIEKRLAGADVVYMVYDKANRLVMTQDGNQRERGYWLHNVYDDLNRLRSQSLVHNSGHQVLSTIRIWMSDRWGTLPPGFTTIAVLSENEYGE